MPKTKGHVRTLGNATKRYNQAQAWIDRDSRLITDKQRQYITRLRPHVKPESLNGMSIREANSLIQTILGRKR